MNSIKPTESELQILQILWEKGPETVRFVNDAFHALGKPVGYTTTLKIMQIMYEKGLLSREQNGRSHIYTPLVKATVARKQILDRMIDSVFGGSAMSLVLEALGNHKATPEEMKELKALVNQLEKK